MLRLPTLLLIALVVALLALATGPMAATATADGGSGRSGSGSGKGGSSDDEDDDTTTTTSTTTGATTTSGTTTSPATTTVGGAAANERSDVRSVGRCTAGVTAWVRVQGDGRTLDVRLELGDVRTQALWHLALVHERHVSWKGTRLSGSNQRIRVRRSLRDFAGSDTVTAHAWGPAGRSCRVTVVVPA